jgi:hypothetical protein
VGKAAAFVLAVMVSIVVLAMGCISLITGDWLYLACAGIALGICALVAAIEVPLMLWALKRWGQE